MITKDNNLRVMELFFRHPEQKFHLRELERLTKLSMPGIRKIVKKIEKENFLIVKKEKLVTNVYATRNEKFIALKRAYNLYSMVTSDLLTFLKDHYEEPEAIILFGSYSKGEDISASDIDIAVVSKKQDTPDVSLFEKRLDRKIRIYEISIEKAESEFLNTVANGIVLHGYVRLIK